MDYKGFGAWCTAYAFLNTVKCRTITPELYTLLSGTPFGLKHRHGDSFRILTPLIEPCFSVESTSSMLGYDSTENQFCDAIEAGQFLSRLPLASCAMVGPIDMGFLPHLPQNMYYCGQSHYISVEKIDYQHLLVIDSEGVINYSYGINAFHKVLNVKNIPEANGTIKIWNFEKQNDFLAMDNWEHTIISIAAENLQRAEQEGQGSKAITACADVLSNVDMKEWYLKLCYELNYLIQRKNLFLRQLLKLGAEIQIRLIEKQLDVLCHMRKHCMCETKIEPDFFRYLANYEQELAIKVTQLTDEVVLNDINN